MGRSAKYFTIKESNRRYQAKNKNMGINQIYIFDFFKLPLRSYSNTNESMDQNNTGYFEI